MAATTLVNQFIPLTAQWTFHGVSYTDTAEILSYLDLDQLIKSAAVSRFFYITVNHPNILKIKAQNMGIVVLKNEIPRSLFI